MEKYFALVVLVLFEVEQVVGKLYRTVAINDVNVQTTCGAVLAGRGTKVEDPIVSNVGNGPVGLGFFLVDLSKPEKKFHIVIIVFSM